jgi:phospholipid transport system substrate-binding protein
MNYLQTSRTRFCAVIFLALAIFALPGISSATAPDPVKFLKNVVDEIVAILENKELASPALKEERRARVVAVVEKNFDFREMSMRALGKHWRQASPAEQDQFVVLFKKLLENTYINRIDTYSGEQTVFKRHIAQGDRAIVYSGFLRNNTEIPVNYTMRNTADRWMIYDVQIEGVSLVNNYRSQFTSILGKENFAVLIARLEDRVRKLAAEQ